MPTDLVPATFADLAGCLDGLDGFPIRPLILDYLATPANDVAARARLARLIDDALTHWLSIVSRDIQQMPPPTMSVLEDIARNMAAVHASLFEVRDQFRRIAQARTTDKVPESLASLAQLA